MTRAGRLKAEVLAEYRSFVRRRTALFFTFVFPLLIVLVYAAAIRAGDGEFLGAPASFYLPGYLALVIVFAPLSRVAGSVPRDLENDRFEKLATTPLRHWEWLLARVVVAGGFAVIPAIAVLAIARALTPVTIYPSPWVVPLGLAVVVTFAGVGAIIGRLADSEDGAIAIGNAIGFPIVFFSETLLPTDIVPEVVEPALALSPVTHFARATRIALDGGHPEVYQLVVLTLVALATFAVGARMLPTVAD